jgi:hypothetical protein
MTIGTISAVPVLAPNLLHVVETLTPVWNALARIMRPRLLHEKENQSIVSFRGRILAFHFRFIIGKVDSS